MVPPKTCNIKCQKENIRIHFEHIFEAWAQFSNHKPFCLEEVKMQPLWCNRYIAINGKSFFDKYLANIGINFIADVWNEHSGKVHKINRSNIRTFRVIP